MFTDCMCLNYSIALGTMHLHSPTKCKAGVEHSYFDLKSLWSTQHKRKGLHQCSKPTVV